MVKSKSQNPIFLLLAMISMFVFTTPGVAQETAGADFKETSGINEGKVDLPVPTSPAFTALGLTPNEVIRPATPRMLATELLNGMDANGNLQSGFALDTAPYMLFYGNTLKLRDYKKNPDGFSSQRLAARTQLSFAMTKGESDDDEAIRLALGLRLTPWDEGDPRLDEELIKCFREVNALNDEDVNNLREKIFDMKEKEVDTTNLEEMVDERVKELDKQCRVDARARNWGRSGWSLGIAPIWISTTGKSDDLEFNSAAFWTSLAYGFDGLPGLEDSSQLVLGLRYTPEESVPHPTLSGSFIEQDTFVAALQLRFAPGWLEDTGTLDDEGERITAPNLILTLEADYIDADRKGGLEDDTTFRLSLAAEFKIPGFDDTYLKFSMGGEGGGDNSNEAFALGTLKVGF